MVKHLFEELQQKMKHGFTSRILKTKHNQINGNKEGEAIWSKQNQTGPEQRSCCIFLGRLEAFCSVILYFILSYFTSWRVKE